MLTCGMYDGSGEFALRTGIPTKSGVGGGLLSVSKKKMGIGIYGPSLDKKGNCIAGCELLGYISEAFLLSAYFSEDGRQFPSLTMVGSFPAIMVTMYPFFPKLIATTFPFFVWKI